MTTNRSTTGLVLVLMALVPAQRTLAEGSNAPAILPEIVVTATRIPENVEAIPASVQVIDSEALSKMNAVTVDEAIRTATGLDVQGGEFPGDASKINMRGLTTGFQSERVLVLMDGRRLNDQYQGNTEFALLPLDNVDRIEIVRGPASALYGSNAEGGVINIITKKGTTTPATLLSAAGGSHDTVRTLVSHGEKTGPFDYFLSASYLDTAGYTTNSDGSRRDWTDWNLNGNLGWEFGKDSEIRAYLGDYQGKGDDENSHRDVRNDYESAVYSLNWDPKRDAELRVRAYRNGSRQEYDWKAGGESIYRQYTLGSEAQQSLWLGERQLATAGLDARVDSVDADEVLQSFDKSTTTLGVYGQDEVRLFERWRVTAGLRDDYNNDFGSELSPRVGLLFQAAPTTEFYASANRAHRAPAISDRRQRPNRSSTPRMAGQYHGCR